jgi:ribonuclease E
MTKRMLIDATHAEETRVVVLDGSRLEDFDVETSNKRQLKGNIYLAKVVRVEPSLQAAFVEYGGNRHGFLAFGEIHPDYYQIPVADRQRLIEMQAEEARLEEEEEDRAAERADAGEAVDEPEQPDVAASPDAEDAEDPEEVDIADAPATEATTAEVVPIEARSGVDAGAEVSEPVAIEPSAAPEAAQPARIVTETVSAPTLFEVEETYEPAIEPHGPRPDPLDLASEPGPVEASIEALDAEPSVDESASEESDDTGIPDDTGYLVEPVPEQPPP